MYKKMLKFSLLAITCIVVLVLSSCKLFSKELYTKTYYDYFDTVITISGYEKKVDKFEENLKEINEILKKYHRLYDIYYEYSGINNICTINKNAGKSEVVVGQEIIDLLKYSIDIYGKTDGLLNVAMGSVLKIWHDEREDATYFPEDAKVPSKELLMEASKHTNINDIIINETSSTVYLKDKDMLIDVGAVAKGYVTDIIAKYLIDKKVTSYILNLGGNIRLIGSNTKDEPWRVGIQNPDLTSEKASIRVFNLKDCSVVTSGSYQRYYEVDGIRYHHIINPKTLMPENEFLSVSVITKDAALADCLSTTLFNMSIDEGKKLIMKYENTYVMWIDKNYQIYYSDGLESFL